MEFESHELVTSETEAMQKEIHCEVRKPDTFITRLFNATVVEIWLLSGFQRRMCTVRCSGIFGRRASI